MSSVYHTEPPTQGKVLLHTTFGDIDIELWPKEAPLACRNFIQLALEGYYDQTCVHRIIKDFMVQMGEGEATSIWGRPFKDEIHGRIRFNHRGQVAVVNDNKPNSNGSQFFITLGPCEWLDRKHTIFGKITGNTMYNVLRLNDTEVDSNDKPTETFKIIKIEVLSNPFDDIIPRDISKLSKKPSTTTNINDKNIVTKKMSKDLKLLSFGEDAEDEEAVGAAGASDRKSLQTIKGGMHSSHDSKLKDSKLSSEIAPELREAAEEVANRKRKATTATTQSMTETRDEDRDRRRSSSYKDKDRKDRRESEVEGGNPMDFEQKMKDKIRQKERSRTDKGEENNKTDHHRKQSEMSSSDRSGTSKDHSHAIKTKSEIEEKSSTRKVHSNNNHNTKGYNSDNDKDNNDNDGDKALSGDAMQDLSENITDDQYYTTSVRKAKMDEEFGVLKQQLLRSRKAIKILTGTDAEKAHTETSNQNLLTTHQEMRKRFISKKKEYGDRQNETLARLQQFQSKLKTEKSNLDTKTPVEAPVESYHGQILEKDSDEDDIKLDDWHIGKLKFRKKHMDDQYRALGGDGRRVDDYKLIDSRMIEKKDPMSLLGSIGGGGGGAGGGGKYTKNK
eukprot:gene10585-22088_t